MRNVHAVVDGLLQLRSYVADAVEAIVLLFTQPRVRHCPVKTLCEYQHT